MTPSPSNPTAAQYLAVAYDIGITLAKTALWDGARCNWIGSAVEGVNGVYQVVNKSFGPELYSGTAGIALFLSLLLQEQPDQVLQETMTGAVNHVLDTDMKSLNAVNYGYYGGKLGIADALIRVGETARRKDWEAAGWELLMDVCREPLSVHEVDVIGGAAGAIPVLLKHYQQDKNQDIAAAMNKCGDFLLAHAHRTDAYWSWPSIGMQHGTTGYSHGAAGMATALLELYGATGNTAYYTAAMMGYNFERTHYNPQIQNWPDFREFKQTGTAGTDPYTYGETWCHGAPGIALSRLRAWQLTNDGSFRQEAEIALATTHRSIYNQVTNPTAPANFSICHGLAGNADVLLEGGKVLGNPLFTRVAYEVGAHGFEKWHQTGLMWPSGVNDPTGATPGMQETPGLMLGLAGTGYFYLRLALPEKMDSLLLL